ncbi:MAG: FtsQ-type POTRA domain-containing protein [Acidobacteriia bacterium]|nr:FtsQ-type POTRA domain-containing protein [Terriglobia bacterium]
MARKSGSTILQEELYPQSDEPVRQELDDARLFDLDVDEESPFLRGQKRVSVRRSTLPKKTATRLTWIALTLTLIFLCAIAVAALYHYGEHSWRFRINSSDDIETSGLGNVTRPQVMEVLGEDLGRNIFFVPLEQRRKQLEQIPWVESASVMRFVPNRLKVEIRERTPVAFARIGSRIMLVDTNGALMELPVASKKRFSFPVILGFGLAEPQSIRASRMKTYTELISQLDSGGARYSQNLSEIDLSDPDDVKALANDSGGEVLVHLGSSDFLERFKVYVAHVQEWRQQFSRLDSVDLRYEHQIVVNPDLQGPAKQPPLSVSAAKAAVAAGVKPAALVSHELTSGKPAAAVPLKPSATKPEVKTIAAKKKPGKIRHRRSAWKKTSAVVRHPSAPAPSQLAQSSASVPAVTTQRTNPAVSPAGTTAKPGTKPSPAIPKRQEH